MRKLHVAVSQINAVALGPQENLKRIHRQVKSASAVGVDLILFGETVIHAYNFSPENLALAEAVGGPLTSQVSAWAAEYNIIILAGFIEKDDVKLYNSHLVARPDGSISVERKHKITDSEIAGGLTGGKAERTVFDFNGVKCAIIICADSGIENLHTALASQGVEYRLCPTAGGNIINGKPIPYIHEDELESEEKQALAAEYRQKVCVNDAIIPEDPIPFTGFASANAMGDDGTGIRHMGHCMIVDKYRVLRAQIPGTLVIEHQEDMMVHATLTFK
ncbi:MAG: carbon-nitrogen hydrolase family protein [bacterium]